MTRDGDSDITDATMQQVQALWDLTCVGGNLGLYDAVFAVPVLCADVPC